MARAGSVAILAALSLGGCRDQGADAPPVKTDKPAGPVNPDVSVISYACADGQTIVAGYPDRETAVVTYKDHAYTLKLARSASGARYTGYGLQWWTKGARATIAALRAGEETASGPGLDCVARAAPTAPATRISSRGGR